MQYGWWFAHWAEITRRERAAIALAGAACDLDGLSLFGGGDAYYRYHHMLFHNAGATLAVIPLAGIFFWRRPLVWLLVVFAFAAHIVEDYFTVAWDMRPWAPFSATVVNLGNHLPGWVVQDLFQSLAILFILGVTIWIYLRYHRTPLEIISPAFDNVIIDYAVLPWRNRCADCGHRAHFRCLRCGRTICANHAKMPRGLRVECKQCPPSSPPTADQNAVRRN